MKAYCLSKQSSTFWDVIWGECIRAYSTQSSSKSNCSACVVVMWVFLARNSQFWTWWAFLCDFGLLLLDHFVSWVHLFKRLVIYLDLLVWLFCKHHLFFQAELSPSYLWCVEHLVQCVLRGAIVIQSSLLLIVIKHSHSFEQELGLGQTREKASLGHWRGHQPRACVPQRNIKWLQHEAGLGIVYASPVFFHVRKFQDEL